MPYVNRKRTRYRVWESSGRFVLIAIGLGVVGGLWWWLSSLGPQGAGAVGRGATDDQEIAARRIEVEAILAEVGAGGAEDEIARLEQARDLQESILAAGGANGGADARQLAGIERQLADARARRLRDRIRAEQAAGERALAEGETSEAARHWQAALEAQREVNRSAAGPAAKNFVLETRLEVALAELEAAPLAAEVESALTAGREAVAAENWARALSAYAVAKAGQTTLNAEYSKTKYANTLRLGEIERELASLDAAAVAMTVDEREAEGDAALAADDDKAAVAAFAEARQIQERVNAEFPRSRFLSSARVEELEAKRQTAASLPRLRRLRELDREIGRHLGLREVESAVAAIDAAMAQIEDLQQHLPKSEQLDPALGLKFSFLASQRDRLAEVQDAVFERLRPLPGVGEFRLLQTEVPQSLYLQVMKTNPSRRVGRAFPVDSVSWFEARQFCERLGWMLGRPVRLPRQAEFVIAVGGLAEARAAAEEAVTLRGDAPSESRAMAAGAPNRAGFFDLIGNVAEWLDAPAGDVGREPAPVAGGSYLDDLEVLAALPVTEMPRSDRARHLGFRVVVETGVAP